LEGTHIRIYKRDKDVLDKMMDERGFGSMAQLIHWILFVDTRHNSPYDELEMEVRKLKQRVAELEGRGC